MARIRNDSGREDPLHQNGRDVNIPSVIDDRDSPIREHVVPILDDLNPGIVRPHIQAQHFELKPLMFQMLQTERQFGGLPTEDSRASLNTLPSGMVASWSKGFVTIQSSKHECQIEERKCPMHGFQHWTQMEMFYNGLNAHTRMAVGASINGTLLDKWYNEAYKILESIANNDYQYPTIRVGTGRRVAGVVELDAITSLTAQRPILVQEMKVAKLTSVYCEEDHVFDECPSNLASNGNNILISVGVIKEWDIPEVLFNRMSQEYMAKINVVIQSQAATLRALENQVVQIANALSSRQQGTLPSNTENSRSQGKEYCKAITLRSGTQLSGVIDDADIEEDNLNFTHMVNSEPIMEQSTIKKSKQKNVQAEPARVSNKNVTTKQPQQVKGRPLPSFPQRFKRSKQYFQFKKILGCPKVTSYQHTNGGSIGANVQLHKFHE
ncbi:aspartic proteinase CDR1-like [Gossypium australe]|uniref:Aspartic proteinase CDR1-like n=1 Tax=Gossypium australe TaxID=47621 RepID=A0A5B6UYR6_9ROSI|nr:aspartic proteinase CDR1-like [Gossypium australe]